MKNTLSLFFFVILIITISCKNTDMKILDNGVVFNVPQGKMKLEVCREDIIRVMVSPSDTFSSRKSLMLVENPWKKTAFSSEIKNDTVFLKTEKFLVKVGIKSGAVKFFDIQGKLVLAERDTVKKFTSASVCGENTQSIRQQWESPEDEKLYGLGHHQNGLFNNRGANIDLWQENWEIVVPFFTSSRGYGILWDNY